MSGQPELSLMAGGFLLVVGAAADAIKFGLEFLFGIGLILDPFVISPITALVFWVVLQHNNIPMFSGRRGASGWINLAVAEAPGIDALPDWTVYALYLIFAPRVIHTISRNPKPNE